MPLVAVHNRCHFYWGTHGCDLENGHVTTIHHCGGNDFEAGCEDDANWPCSEYDEQRDTVRYGYIDEKKWSEWMYHGSGWRMSD
jgi:hypothetical protein